MSSTTPFSSINIDLFWSPEFAPNTTVLRPSFTVLSSREEEQEKRGRKIEFEKWVFCEDESWDLILSEQHTETERGRRDRVPIFCGIKNNNL